MIFTTLLLFTRFGRANLANLCRSNVGGLVVLFCDGDQDLEDLVDQLALAML